MPRLTSNDMEQHRIGNSNFTFEGTRIERLGATKYTLVTIAIDVTGSTSRFADELRQALIAAVDGCRKSPLVENLLVRVVIFSSDIGIVELHGFKELHEIDTSTYGPFDPDGLTPLYDATFASIGAMVEYGQRLMENDYLTNAIGFIVTDGGENASTQVGIGEVRAMLRDATKEEKLESLVSILVGVNAAQASAALASFRADAGIDEYVDIADANAGKLAKLARFISQSVTSQSQALGTGGPSQNIQATI